MKVTEAKFTRRFNTGDYEHEEYTLTAQVEGKESGAEVLSALKAEVNEAFIGETESVEETKQPAKKQKAKKEETKNVKSKTNHVDDEDPDDEDPASEDAGDDGESDQDDEAADYEDGDDSDDSSDSDESDEGSDDDEGEDEVKPPVKKASGKKASPAKGGDAAKGKESKKTFRKKPQVYSRSIEQHKETFSGLLRSVNPDWKKTEATKLKAKKTSEQMEGKEFLDEDGEVLASFKAEVKKLMAAKK